MTKSGWSPISERAVQRALTEKPSQQRHVCSENERCSTCSAASSVALGRRGESRFHQNSVLACCGGSKKKPGLETRVFEISEMGRLTLVATATTASATTAIAATASATTTVLTIGRTTIAVLAAFA